MISPGQIKAGRALLGWSQADLAGKAELSKTALVSIEGSKSDPKASTLARIQRALESAGIEFTNGDAPGVRLKPTKRKR